MKEKMDNLKYYLSALTDIALPRCCIVCGRELGIRESHLCIYCSADFPFTRFWISTHNEMADRLNLMIGKDMEENSGKFERYSFAAALFFYHGEAGYKKIPQGLKYRKRIGEGRYFSRMLADKIFSAEWFRDVDMVVPVPLHWKRRWKRGYNQAEIIAEELAGNKKAELCRNLLLRGRYTATQTRMAVEDKKTNVSGAFSINERIASRCSPSHILLVDDVFTTGATMNACHRVLRNYFGRQVRISAVTLGFVSSG